MGPSGKEEEVLMTLAYAGADQCHCMPEWQYKGVFYNGCASTPDGKEDWCYVLQDARLCQDVHGEEEGGLRWRYCREDEGEEEHVIKKEHEPKSKLPPTMQVNVVPMILPVPGVNTVLGMNETKGKGHEEGKKPHERSGAISRF